MLGQHRQAAVVLAARRGGQPVGDLLLEHQHHVGDVVGLVQPAHQQGRRDVVGQVGDDPARRRARGRPRSMPAGRRPRSTSSRPPAAACEFLQGRRWRAGRPRWRPRGPRPRAAARGSGRRGRGRPRSPCPGRAAPAARAMRRVRLRSSRKCWPRRLRASRPCAAMVSRSGGRPATPVHRRSASARRRRAMSSAMRERGDQARRIGAAGAGDVERRAVVGRGPHEGQAERDVDAARRSRWS